MIAKAKKILENIPLKSLDTNIFEFMNVYVQEVKDDNIDDIAKSMAFSFMMAIFPGVIFLFTLIPHVPIPDFTENILSYLQNVLPQGIYEYAFTEIRDIIGRKRSGLMSFGFLLALLSATNGSLAMISGFNTCYQTKEKRSFLKTRLLALNLTFLLTFVLLFSAFTLVVIDVVMGYLVSHHIIFKDINYYLILLLKPAVTFCTFYLSLASIYHFAPTIKEKWGFLSAGAFLASVMCVLATLLLSVYFTNFASYNKLYGSIGTIIALMFWLYVISNVILLGFEFNVTIEKFKSEKKLNSTKTVGQ